MSLFALIGSEGKIGQKMNVIGSERNSGISVQIMDVNDKLKIMLCFMDPLTRKVNEAVRIANCESTTQLNSKAEWHGSATVRLVAEGGGWG